MYVDAGGLLRTDLGAPAKAAILAAVHSSLAPASEQCLRQALQAIRDVAIGAAHHGALVLAGFDDSAFPVATCLAELGAKASTTKDGEEAFELNGSRLAHRPGVLLFGDKEVVAAALRPRAGDNFPSLLSLEAGEYAVWSLTAKREEMSLSGAIEQSSERFRVRLEGDLPPPMAGEMEQGWQTAKGEIGHLALTAAEKGQVEKLMDAVDLHHDSGHVVGTADLNEPVADQARDLGAVAALLRAAIREYLLNAMKAEARNSTNAIAMDLQGHARRGERGQRGAIEARSGRQGCATEAPVLPPGPEDDPERCPLPVLPRRLEGMGTTQVQHGRAATIPVRGPCRVGRPERGRHREG